MPLWCTTFLPRAKKALVHREPFCVKVADSARDRKQHPLNRIFSVKLNALAMPQFVAIRAKENYFRLFGYKPIAAWLPMVNTAQSRECFPISNPPPKKRTPER